MGQVGGVPIDVALARGALVDEIHRLGDAVRSAASIEVAVPGLRWSAADVLAHLATQAEAFAGIAVGDHMASDDLRPGEELLTTSDRVAGVNARFVEAVEDRRPGPLLSRIETAVHRFLEVTDGRDRREPFVSWEGDLDLGLATGILVTELAVHGYDVAGAIGGPKSISRVSAVQGLRTAASLSDHYLRPEARIGPPRRFLVHLGKEEPFAIEIVDGVSAASTELPAVVDCHIGARPGPLLLVLTGRRSPAASALRREVVAWGRRPWLALRFAGYFESP